MFIFIFIFMFIFFYYLNLILSYEEKFSLNIIFLEKEVLYNILINNKDNYYDTFYVNDFKTRGINNINEYERYIKDSVSTIDYNDKIKIKKCIRDADIFLESINFEWFNGSKAKKIPWKIGYVIGKLYEFGLPHTRDDIIILSRDNVKNYNINKLTKTLIHEKVHIYQKIYKDDVSIYLLKNKFTKFKKRDEDDNIRANPDLDNWIYKDSENNLYTAIYNNNPKTIEDITYNPINNQSYEHPYEKMAIFIEKLKFKD